MSEQPGFTREPQPYPDHSGVALRMLQMPVDRPGDPPEPSKSVRRDGSECDLMATLGARPARQAAPDDRVHDWSPDLSQPTVTRYDPMRGAR